MSNPLHNKIHRIIDKYRHVDGIATGEITQMILDELNISFGDFKDSDVNFNGCHEQAIKALNYIGKHGKTAAGGSEFPNAECCFDIASDLEISLKPIKGLFK
jgi:hypothetical protein